MTTPKPIPEIPDAPLVVAAFLARYLADQEAGEIQARSAYEDLFPGYASVIATEFERLQQGVAEPEDLAGERLAGYRIERELGRGGQGVVYLAVDDHLDRRVALKVLPGAFSAAVARQRLLREAQAASRLDDPGICTVYDAGELDGVAYIAMQYVAGESLQERIDADRTEQVSGGVDLFDRKRVERLLQLFEGILRSLHRAHGKGLVHRDVKPSNLMVAVDGTPRILDFGLAAFDEHPDGSLTGEVAIGTPAYMSPEQLTAREGRVDARSDVFSLAVTMYEALTLTHPFAAPTRERLYRHILEGEAPPLGRRRGRGPSKSSGDLDVVLQCALAKERGRRYGSAEEFADDLRRVRLGEPIAARRVTAIERTALWARRNPVVAALLVLLFTTLATFGYAMFDKSLDLSDALASAEVAQGETARALSRERDARARSEGLYLAAEARTQLKEDAELGLLLAREGRQRLDHELTRGALLTALERYRPRPFVVGIEDASWALLAPDGSRCAIACPGAIVLVDMVRGDSVATIPCPRSELASVFWSEDSLQLAVAEQNLLVRIDNGAIVDDQVVVRLHHAADGRFVAALDGHRGRVHAVEFGERWLLTCDGAPDEEAAPRDGVVRVWQRDTGALAFSLADAGRGASAARFCGGTRAETWPDFEMLSFDGVYRRVLGGRGRVLAERRLVPEGLERLPSLFFAEPGVVYVDYRQMTAHFAGRGDDELLERFECCREDEPVTQTMLPGERSWHPSGVLWTRSGAALGRERVHVLDADELTVVRELDVPPREIVAMHPGGRAGGGEPTLTAVFADGSLRVWSLRDGSYEDLPSVGGGVLSAAFSRDGARCVAVTTAGRVRLFEVAGRVQLPNATGIRLSPWPAVSADAGRAFVFDSSAVQALNLATMERLWSYGERGVEPTSLACTRDGELCAIGHHDGTVVMLAGATGKRLATLAPSAGFDREVRQLRFDAAEQQLLILRGTAASVWHVAQRRELRSFADVPMVGRGWFVDDGRAVVLSHTRAHQLRSTADGASILPSASPKPNGAWHEGIPCGVAGSRVLLSEWFERPGGRVGGYGKCWLLDAATGQIQVLPGDAHGRAGLSPDGRFAGLPKKDGSIDWLDVEDLAVVRTLRGHEAPANRVLFAVDGRVCATGYAAGEFGSSHDERSICVWSRDGRLLQRVGFADAAVSWFAIDAAGEWVVALSQAGELRRFPVDPLALLRSMRLRGLFDSERKRFGLERRDD